MPWELATGPTEVLALPDRHANAPALAVVEPGGPNGPAQLALVALAGGGTSFAHPDVQLVRLRLDGEQLVVDAPPMVFGPESHGWGELARAPGDIEQLAMAWYADPGQVGRVSFRTLDVASWTANPPVDVDFDGEVALALVPGAGVGPSGVGHAGDGYALAWRETVEPDAMTWIAVLDPSGQITLGPHPQGIAAPYPGHTPALTWTGERYLVATGHGDCSEPGCPARLTLERVLPAGEGDDGGVDLVWTLDTAGAAFRPSMDSLGGSAWVAWSEGEEGEVSARRSLWLRRLVSSGEASGPPVSIASHVHPKGRVVLRASPDGLAVAHGRDGDLTLPAGSRGRSLLALHQLGGDGAPARAPLAIPISAYSTYGPVAVASVDEPRGLVVAWSAQSETGPLEVIQAAFFRCRAAEPCETSSDCAEDEYCASPCCAEGGLCTPKPDGCFDDCPGVTACGGEPFCNACEASLAGRRVPQAGCAGAVLHAALLPSTAYDRVELTKAEPFWDLCLHLVFSSPDDGFFPGVVATSPWGLERAEARTGAAGCADEVGPFDWKQATSAIGSATFTPGAAGLPCAITSDVLLQFAGEPAVAGVLASALPVDGCLP